MAMGKRLQRFSEMEIVDETNGLEWTLNIRVFSQDFVLIKCSGSEQVVEVVNEKAPY